MLTHCHTRTRQWAWLRMATTASVVVKHRTCTDTRHTPHARRLSPFTTPLPPSPWRRFVLKHSLICVTGRVSAPARPVKTQRPPDVRWRTPRIPQQTLQTFWTSWTAHTPQTHYTPHVHWGTHILVKHRIPHTHWGTHIPPTHRSPHTPPRTPAPTPTLTLTPVPVPTRTPVPTPTCSSHTPPRTPTLRPVPVSTLPLYQPPVPTVAPATAPPPQRAMPFLPQSPRLKQIRATCLAAKPRVWCARLSVARHRQCPS